MVSVLIVEDELITAEAIKEILEKMDINTLGISTTGIEAINFVKKNIPDLILMDIVLKGEINGIDTSRKILEIIDIPIIFLTAFNDIETINQAKLVEPYGYIVKPVTSIHDLRPTIELALFNHRSKKELKEDKERLEKIKNYVLNESDTSTVNSYYNNLSKKDIEEILDYISSNLEVLSNKERYIILNLLRTKGSNSTHIQKEISKSQSTTSHHLMKLEENNFILSSKKGRFTFYQINSEAFLKLISSIEFLFEIKSSDYQKIRIHKTNSVSQFLKCTEILSNKERLYILFLLQKGPLKISKLETLLNKAQSTISHHMKLLEDGNYIQTKKLNRFTIFEPNNETIKKYCNQFRKFYFL